MTTRNLDALFKPDAIALIGGSGEGGHEEQIARSLMGGGFKGPIMPVDPSRWALAGALAYPDIASLPVTPDLAIITRPLAEAPTLITQLGQRGARAALLTGDARSLPAAERQRLRQAVLDAAQPWLLRVLGPNSQGFHAPRAHLNVTLSPQLLPPGQIALVSESGTIGQTALDLGLHQKFGFSYVIHLGEKADIDLADILDYLAGDYQTRSILLYLEQIGDARKFMSAARRAARIKPVIVLKPRCYPPEPDDAVYAAAFRRAGLLRVDDSDEFLQMIDVLNTARRASRDRLVILGNSSSLNLLAVDTLQRYGGRLAQLSEATQQGLESLINPSAAPNPVDLGDEAGAEAYGQALDLVLADAGVDSVLVIKTPNPLHDAAEVAEAMLQRLTDGRPRMIASFPGPSTSAAARQRLLAKQVPAYETASAAVRAFMRIVQYRRNQALLMETPPSLPEEFTPDATAARAILDQARRAGRNYLDGYEAMQLLTAYGIPVVETRKARSPEEAAELAARMQPPVALKIASPEAVIKSRIGGVARYLTTPEAVQLAATRMLAQLRELAPTARFDGFLLQPIMPRDDAYELTMGVRDGGDFGPVIYFGQGGAETEVIADRAYGLPPLNLHLASEIMGQTRIHRRLRYSLLRRANLNALALTLVKISQMVIDLDALDALDINPLWANAHGVVALDARVQLRTAPGPRPLAIQPYPKALEEVITLPNGRELLLRPVLPEDEPALHALVGRASPEDLRRRFFQPIRELSHDVAASLTQIDYQREMALVAAAPGLPGKAEIHGIVNLSADPNHERAEYSILVDRALMGLGLGNRLMRRIIQYARAKGIHEIYGEVLTENKTMLQMNRALGFRVHTDHDDPGLKHVVLPLHASASIG